MLTFQELSRTAEPGGSTTTLVLLLLQNHQNRLSAYKCADEHVGLASVRGCEAVPTTVLLQPLLLALLHISVRLPGKHKVGPKKVLKNVLTGLTDVLERMNLSAASRFQARSQLVSRLRNGS